MEERVIQLQTNLLKFIRHVDDLTDEDDPAGNGFHREYRDLREKAAQNKEDNTFPATTGREPYNMKKNRYKDIIAYDYSRVTLQHTGVEGSDYINANLIQDPYNNDGYIASQGPLPHTVDDFWRMIMEYRVKVVIMACKLIEGNKKKCAMYWPKSVGEEENYGYVNVKLTKENVMKEDCTVRVLEVWYGDECQTVTQYHYTGWPDHGIPEDREVILAMVAKMRDIRKNDSEKAPILIHCSAGCGRTGTVCAIDYAWEILKGGRLTRDFNLKNIVEIMREQRQSMIQTPDQYEMAHLAVRDLFQKHLEIMEENIYMNYGGNDEEQDALDSLNMVTDSASTISGSTPKDDDVDIYSYLSATKVLYNSVRDTVDRCTNEEGEKLDSDIRHDDKHPSRPSVPSAAKPALPIHEPTPPQGDVNKDTKPVVKNKYQNVAVASTSYENMDLVVIEQNQGSSNISKSTPPQERRFSPQLPKKQTPPSPSAKSQPSGPVFVGKSAESSVHTGKKADSPVLAQKKMNSPVLAQKKMNSPVLAQKKMNSPVVTDASDSFVYAVASKTHLKPAVTTPPSSGPKFVSSGPKWSSAPSKPETKPDSKEPLAAKLPKDSMLTPQPVQVKATSKPPAATQGPATSNGKHVTKIMVSGERTPVSNTKTVSEPNNNLYSIASHTKEQKTSGPVSSASTGGDIYTFVQKDGKRSSVTKKDKGGSSPLRSSQGQPKPVLAPQQDIYSQARNAPETGFQSHILGGDGSYSEVVIGEAPKTDDNLYSCVDVAPASSPGTAPPEIPYRGYNDSPHEPPPRGPGTGQTDTFHSTLNKGSTTDQKPFKGLFTKIKGSATDHQYTDTSSIKGFHERIGQKPMGKREEPSRWKKIFKKQ
ncbi:tyrosine-protein phosphatase non-receptor type 12-like isoform X2 [Ylistrum balloti]|uniref:tyrosine-protein phosphatase non-receptor type 12-like isoform X2 n=1 Tax=Ylistrum balloti TaxID=509963 RepID=UPI002905B2E3|nr:tyrosine-protein phosphatase non-receptor type 12-like isoform X2 [Ylistrum balloti]